jgi:hypothetical protein
MGTAISSLVFQPPEPLLLYPNVIWLTNARSTRIPAFFIKHRAATITFLFSHGNAEDLGMIYEWFYDFSRELRVRFASVAALPLTTSNDLLE